MEAIFRHFGHHGRNLGHLVPLGRWVCPRQLVPTAAAHRRLEVPHGLDLLDRDQRTGRAGVTRLGPALALTAGARARQARVLWSVTRGRAGGVARVTVHALTQRGQFGLQHLHLGQQGQHKLLDGRGRLGPLLGGERHRSQGWVWDRGIGFTHTAIIGPIRYWDISSV